jgi:predicted SnoaL-like aldol condensation-catalyzing enzyme
MKTLILLTAVFISFQSVSQSTQDLNKAAARGFYENLWFSNNTASYEQYLAKEYIIHDIGEEKGLVEPAIRQKEIADFFWGNGNMSGEIDFQVSEGDIVATRWHWTFAPSSLLGRIAIGETNIPIINAFRFENGKIVEIWNHRHDIDIPGRRNALVMKGLAFGLLIALIPLYWAIRLRRKNRLLLSQQNT